MLVLSKMLALSALNAHILLYVSMQTAHERQTSDLLLKCQRVHSEAQEGDYWRTACKQGWRMTRLGHRNG